jgi:Zn-dependent protease
MQEIGFIFQIAIIIVSIVFHELSHGYAAYFLGDPTAKYAGRLTLNPFKHLELFGSFIVPLLTLAFGGIVFGWAKPVPYNPYNLRAKKYGEVIVALAGPASNILIAIVFSLYIRTLGGDIASSPTGQLAVLIVLVNLTLAIFNLIPIPPLDGSKILWGLLPYRWHPVKAFIERNMIAFIIVVILTISFVLSPIVSTLFSLLTGVSFI